MGTHARDKDAIVATMLCVEMASYYAAKGMDLPPANVVEFRLEDDNKVIFRPSGTEPKVKAYLFSKGATREESEAVRDKLKAAAEAVLS